MLLLTAVLAGCGRWGEPEPTPTPEPTATPDPHEGEVQVLDGSGGYKWVKDAPNRDIFPYVATGFNVTDQIPSYDGEGLTMLRGIDVSDHQLLINWQQVADAGIEFAVIRCGYRSYTEGNLNVDAHFYENIQGALDAGLEVGVYFFSQATSVWEAAEEAVYVIRLIQDYDVTLPVFFDWEVIGVDEARTDNVTGEQLTDFCLEFCKLIRDAGYQPGMYSYLKMAYEQYELDRLDDIVFWMGDPGTKPIFYFDHDFWQYSYTGTVPGIEVDVDLDAMYIRDRPDTADTAVG